MNQRIFIVDDEPDMVRIAADLLEEEGYHVTASTHPEEAIKKIRTNPPDLILLDIRMPDKDGLEVCRELKSDPQTNSVPIIMISVKAEEADVVLGLELGAEDYIPKPYRRRELLARVKTALRRADPNQKVERLQVGPFTLDFGSYQAFINKKELSLTPKEFELLSFFLKREGRVLTRAMISESVWGVEYTGSTRTIDVHVDMLRRKLGKWGDAIVGLKGVGYRFEVPD